MPIEIPHVWILSGACVLVGLLAGWLAARIIASVGLERLRIEQHGQLTSISETLRGREAEIEGLKQQLTETTAAANNTRQALMATAEQKAQAMGKLEGMAALEQALKQRQETIDLLHQRVTDLKARQSQLQTLLDQERKGAGEKIALLEEARVNMADAYRALSAQALRENNQTFLDLAKTAFSKYVETARGDLDLRAQRVGELIQPVTEALKRYDQQVQAMERSREKAYGGLSEQVQSLAQTQLALQKETGKLVKALRLPHVRGRWGEMTLKRVAELAGMQDRCDFFEQLAAKTPDGLLRPDMVVMLPGGRKIVVDAKVPLAAYLDSLEANTDAERTGHLAAHVRQLQAHISNLSQKAYWRQFSPTPEFVVLFIPGENFFSAALHQNPRLIEEGIDRGIVIATPTTLITLLKTVAFGWNQEIMAENARTISQLGRELYERIASMTGHLNKLGKDLERCSITYNQVIGTMERRVLSSARKFSELGITGKTAPEQLRLDPGKMSIIQNPAAEEKKQPHQDSNVQDSK